jgi:hypothetical protein
VREQNAAANVPVITQEIYQQVTARSLPRLRERASRCLALIAKKYANALSVPASQAMVASDPELQASSYSANADDVRMLFAVLETDDLIKKSADPSGFFLTAKGLLTAADMAATSSVSSQCFVAMSFNASLGKAWTSGFDPAIRAAGFRPVRIDHKDYIGGITDEIMESGALDLSSPTTQISAGAFISRPDLLLVLASH